MGRGSSGSIFESSSGSDIVFVSVVEMAVAVAEAMAVVVVVVVVVVMVWVAAAAAARVIARTKVACERDGHDGWRLAFVLRRRR